jgi:hypothetical protein
MPFKNYTKCSILISFYLIIKEEKIQAMILLLRSLVDTQIRDLQRTSPSEWKGLLLFLQVALTFFFFCFLKLFPAH